MNFPLVHMRELISRNYLEWLKNYVIWGEKDVFYLFSKNQLEVYNQLVEINFMN